MKQKVVVIGHGYTSRLGVIRALGRVGYEVNVIVMMPGQKNVSVKADKPIDCCSKYVNEVYYCPSDREQLIQLLLEKCTDSSQKVVLFPDSDFSEAAIDENQDRLRNYFVFPNINHKKGAVVTWMDKMLQKVTAQEFGLNVAQGWLIKIVDGQYDLPADLRFPCFPKPLTTLTGGKRGLQKCNDAADLKKVLFSLIQRNATIDVLAEEYKNIETEYALLGFSNGKEVVIPGIIQTISLANGGHFGVARQGIIKPVSGFEQLVCQFEQFVKRTEFCGIFDIDFYKSDGCFYFSEMNLRYGGSGYAYTAMGVNLPDMLVRYLTGQPLEGIPQQITKEAVFINERMCRDDWADNYITTKSLCKMMKTADISFVNDKDDIAPQRKYYSSLFDPVLNLKRIAKKLLRR